MEIILTNKPGKHNYKSKYDLEMMHCPDLTQVSPIYYKGALTAKPRDHVSQQTMDGNHFDKYTW